MPLLVACSASPRPAPAGDPAAYDSGAADAAVSEGGVPETHAPGTWCAGRAALFCDDFDTPAFTAKSWSMTDTKGSSGPGLPPGALDTMNTTSAPNAFTARTPAIAGATSEILRAQSSGAGPDASHVDADFAFAVRVAALGAGPRIEIARIEGLNPITFASYGIALLVSSSGASVELAQGSKAKVVQPLATAPRAGAWSRIAMHLALERTVNGPPTSIVIQIDAGTPETFSLERGMGVRPFFRLGLDVVGPSAPCEVAFDDVTYDAR